MIARRTRRGLILLALLAIFSWLLARPMVREQDQPITGLDTRLNYALHDFKGHLLDDRGNTRLEIEAPLLRNDALTGYGTVEWPNLRIQQANEEWYITAESAVITPDREQMTLNGEVKLLRRNEITGELLDIRTRDVLLNVTPKTASTASGVVLRHAGDRLDATGMNLDMINERIELLSEVQAHYEVL